MKTNKMIDTFRVVDQSQAGEAIFPTLTPQRAEQIANELRRRDRWFDRNRYTVLPEGEGCRIKLKRK